MDLKACLGYLTEHKYLLVRNRLSGVLWALCTGVTLDHNFIFVIELIQAMKAFFNALLLRVCAFLLGLIAALERLNGLQDVFVGNFLRPNAVVGVTVDLHIHRLPLVCLTTSLTKLWRSVLPACKVGLELGHL